MRKHPYQTRQLTNETAANVAKLLNMMTRMPNRQVEYLFNNELAGDMLFASKTMIKRAEWMIKVMDGWYPGCGEPANGRESILSEMMDKENPCWNCGQPHTECHVCEHGRKNEA